MDKTLLKGLMVLEAVTEVDHRPRTIEELASRVGLTRSNTHRTLQTLAHAGYIVKDEDSGEYRATVRLFELGARQLAQMDVRKLAQRAMARLAEQSGETVHLSLLDGIEVVYIDKIDSPQPVRAYSYVGGRAPAYAVATGKVLLAHQPEGYIARYASVLQAHTPKTLVAVDALEEEMRKIRRQGYAANRGEWRATVGGVAVAIFNSLAQPVAALGISGPLERLNAVRMRELAPVVAACAAEVSELMGYRPPAQAGAA
ncbi:IclR family transcriptional regulator [Bordetella genomosp. 11]|uniref:IclR family transcriptional regulator n=1 Tax=Bordetella genomosp. 11 TaxID=1416808 RepID=A0A261UFZ8_9BORD|nr:IclR family transcriptional regulator [Bordetella genomosp. 11]OZI60457.1 IclR family transcriptional regulator [Bordetella genomosp. 11]